MNSGASSKISSATKVYENVSKCEIIRCWVDHPELYNVSYALRTLIQSLQSEIGDEYWRLTLSPVRRLVFALCSTPLPFNHVTEASPIDWDKLERQIQICQQLYPDSYTALSDLVKKLKLLSTEACSPFTKPLISLCNEKNEVSVVIKNPRMNQAVAEYFANSVLLKNAKVVSSRQLRETHICNSLVLIGPCKWFDDYIFLAPCTQHIHVMLFRWMQDTWKPEPVFLHDSDADDKSHKHCMGTMPKIIGQPVLVNSVLHNLKPPDLLPPLPLFRATGGYDLRLQPGEETVLAKICLLSGGRAVLVSADEGTQLIIDLSETGNSIVRRVHANALEPYQYLLLRTSGGGDFIAPLADRILGKLSEKRRKQQSEWKDLMITSAHKRFGVLPRHDLSVRIAIDLRSRKLSKVRPANIHYWMSSRCISPRKEEDFRAVLNFSGIADRTKELWEAMEEIHRAHKRAGQYIRKMLLQRISTVSLEPLERDGEMVFDLEIKGSGTISAFQITDILEEEEEVPVNRLGVLLDLEI